jgi:hypothetical protein
MAVKFVVCIQKDHLGDVSGDDIHVGRLYEVVETSAGHGTMRIIDESGDDFLYPESCFEPVILQEAAALRLRQVLPHN